MHNEKKIKTRKTTCGNITDFYCVYHCVSVLMSMLFNRFEMHELFYQVIHFKKYVLSQKSHFLLSYVTNIFEYMLAKYLHNIEQK